MAVCRTIPDRVAVEFRRWRVGAKEHSLGESALMCSGQGEEELLEALSVRGVGAARLGKAVFEAGRDEREPSSVQCVVGCGELGDDDFAVTALLDHLQDAADLALGPAQPVSHCTQFYWV